MIYLLGTTGTHGGPTKFKNLFADYLFQNDIFFRVDEEGLNFNMIVKFKRFLSDLLFLLKNRKKVNIFIINGTSRVFIQLVAKVLNIQITIRLDGYKYYEVKYLSFNKSLIAFIRKIIVSINIILSDKIIFQSDFIKTTYLLSSLEYFIRKKKFIVILNPCNLNPYKRDKGESILCVEGSIGGIYSKKILKIFSKYKQVFVVGDVSDNEKIKDVNYLGRLERDNLTILFKQNWFAYLPLEPFPPCPNSMIEAITYGIPVIASSSGSNPEILENSNLIFKVPFKWKDDLSNIEIEETEINEKLILLDNNWNLYHDYSVKISKKFETHKILNEYINFILSEN